jgi:hypothetical protein
MTAQSLCIPLHISLLACVHALVIETKRTIPHKKGSLKGKMLKVLRISRGFEETQDYQEKIVHVPIPTDTYYRYQKEIEATLLEAEQKKAQAMELQRRRFIC